MFPVQIPMASLDQCILLSYYIICESPCEAQKGRKDMKSHSTHLLNFNSVIKKSSRQSETNNT